MDQNTHLVFFNCRNKVGYIKNRKIYWDGNSFELSTVKDAKLLRSIWLATKIILEQLDIEHEIYGDEIEDEEF